MSSTKKLINKPADVVCETIKGIVESYPNLQYLDGLPEIKVVLRSDVPVDGTYSKVSLISGGGSGHEPAHAGFVGEGMLTAAVCGDVFASPSVRAIIAAIRAVTGPLGCLLIVKNYTGDRLNFGLAAELAKSEGFKIETVIVGDDCAIPPPLGIAGRRGLAGTLFVHKVAGAAAESGLPLSEVAALARQVASQVSTMGVGLTVCSLPAGGPAGDRIGENRMEMGLGIHGEPGAQLVELRGAREVVGQLLQTIFNPVHSGFSLRAGDSVALLVNSLGGTPAMELMISAADAVSALQSEHSVSVQRVYAGALMTSLDMKGISISVLKLGDRIRDLLDAPTRAPCWPAGSSGTHGSGIVPVPVPRDPSPLISPKLSKTGPPSPEELRLASVIRSAAESIVSKSAVLNEWDAAVGDGDCGTTLNAGATQILHDLETYPLYDPASTVSEIGKSVEKFMGGTSGILYNIFFRAGAAKLREIATPNEPASPLQWCEAFSSAVSSVSKYGGAQRGFRTMLDSMLPAQNILEESLARGLSAMDSLSASTKAALQGAEGTKALKALAGRSSYVPEGLLGSVPDPGAMAFAFWFSGLLDGLE